LVVFHDLPSGVTLANVSAATDNGDPLVKVSVLSVPPGASLSPIPLEFDNPAHVPITYRAQVYSGYEQVAALSAMNFEANLGQTVDEVAFVSRGQNYALFLTADGAALRLEGLADGDSAAVRLRWLEGSASPNVVGLNKQASTTN